MNAPYRQKDHWEGIGRRRPASHPVVQAFSRPKVDFVRRAIPAPGRTMLEIGAGNGFFSSVLQDAFDLTCLDFSMNMLARNPLPMGRKVLAEAERLPFADGAFDAVFCGNLLHHMPDPASGVREMARVARRHVVLVEPNALNPLMFLFALSRKEEHGALKFTPRYLKALSARAGLSLRAFTVQGLVLPNKTPNAALASLRRIDGHYRLGFYLLGVFDKVDERPV